MTESIRYPKRLIEVDLPIKRISEIARNEKDSRCAHIPRLHIYPAARPLAACRAVLCASLWPDPVDKTCPDSFRKCAEKILLDLARRFISTKKGNAQLVADLTKKLTNKKKEIRAKAEKEKDHRFNFWNIYKNKNSLTKNEIRSGLLELIVVASGWEQSTMPFILEAIRLLTSSAHVSLGGVPDTKAIVLDPFSGGGAIPLEALRVDCDTFASDLNTVAISINKAILEHVPKYGKRLRDEIINGVNWIQSQAKKELSSYYKTDEDGSMPIAYLWARTVLSEAPEPVNTFPVEIPLLRTMWLARQHGKEKALRWVRDNRGIVKTEVVSVHYSDGTSRKVRRPLLEVFTPKKVSEVEDGTVKRTSATCPVTGFTISAQQVRSQLKTRKGGANDARLFCVVTIREGKTGRNYRLPNNRDVEQAKAAEIELLRLSSQHMCPPTLLPLEPTPAGGGRGAGRAFGQRAYGMETFSDLFTSRQLLALTTYARLVREYSKSLLSEPPQFIEAVNIILGLLVDRLADLNASLCVWQLNTPNTAHVFGRWAIQIAMDFGEVNPLVGAGGSPESALTRMISSIDNLIQSKLQPGQVMQASAHSLPLPDDSVQVFFTDPPYYDAVPYSDLLDYFYVWLKRSQIESSSIAFRDSLTPKQDECIVDEIKYKDHEYFETMMTKCLAEGRRILQPSGIGVIVFAHKSTAGWESLLQAIVNAGWIIVGSWPIDTEMGSRLRAKKSAALASSVHIVCRPRENPDGSVRNDDIGDWRDVLAELPKRIHAWMPRLAKEGVVGADAIFSCLGPALEIFSSYSQVEKASGEQVTLKEYLEHVWAAVSKEALSMIFSGADATGFEEDARLTAMWLWTLSTGGVNGGDGKEAEEPEDDEETETKGGKAKFSGFTLEYDAARKIAQGLGAHLESLTSLVEVKGDKARLLPVPDRTAYLFGKDESLAATSAKKKKKKQLALGFVRELEQAEESGGWGKKGVPKKADTVLDRIHQAMILFAAGRSEALKRFLVEEGAGRDERFWRLAQALSALYPPSCEEKRWVDGVMARKKGLGF